MLSTKTKVIRKNKASIGGTTAESSYGANNKSVFPRIRGNDSPGTCVSNDGADRLAAVGDVLVVQRKTVCDTQAACLYPRVRLHAFPLWLRGLRFCLCAG